MNIYTGTSINNEIAIGKIFVYINDDFKIEKRHVKDTDGEIKRLKDGPSSWHPDFGKTLTLND